MKYLVLALTLAFSTQALAQDAEQPAPAKSRKKRSEQTSEKPGRSMKPSRAKLADSYPDSVEFNKAFNELYSLIKPEETVQQKTEQAFKQMTRTFSRSGVDSAEAHKAVFSNMNPNLDREVIFTAYRTQLTAEELKSWVSFLRTPAGKKILEVGDKLIGVSGKEVDAQVRRSVNNAIAPLRKAAKASMRQQPEDGSAPVPGRMLQNKERNTKEKSAPAESDAPNAAEENN